MQKTRPKLGGGFVLGLCLLVGVISAAEGTAGAPAPVEVTGQTRSFAAGDDGAIEAGVPLPIPRFTDNGNGTVTDNLTGLIWLKLADCFGQQTWVNALNAANTLASGICLLTDGSLAGDWRLPNIKELQSLIDFGFFEPALSNAAGTGEWTEGNAFSDVQSAPYWSSTTPGGVGGGEALAWFVTLFTGVTDVLNKAEISNSSYVWPVRGGE
jgi:hypothetical protein